MRISLGRLRSLVLNAIREGDASYPYIRDPVAPASAQRDQIGSLADDPKKDPEDQLPPHLRDPEETEDDRRGPIPPVDDDVHALSDPYTTDWSVLPHR